MHNPCFRRFEVIDGTAVGAYAEPDQIHLGLDVIIDEAPLRAMIQRPLAPVDLDLIFLAGTIARIDRTVRRQLASGWERSLHVVMRVHEPDRWQRPDVNVGLSKCLRILTGDRWSFEFEPRSARDQHLQLDLFHRAPENVIALSYSGGLDSYCGAAELVPGDGQTPLLVHTRNGHSNRRLLEATLRDRRFLHVSMPFHLANLDHPEPSYRTRTFTFLVVASVAARSGGGNEVIVSENGQGAIGPALVRFNGEYPYFSTHPIFTRSLANFLGLLWAGDHNISFRHPAVLRTKGEVLESLMASGAIPHWNATRSCSRTMQRTFGAGMPDQCGLCGGCLLRRLALHTAGLGQFGTNVEGYLWSNLAADNFDKVLSRECNWSDNDRDLAVHAVYDLALLADFAGRPDSDADIQNLVEDLAVGLGISVSESQVAVRRLLNAHRDEWNGAIAMLPPSAWLRRIIEERVS